MYRSMRSEGQQRCSLSAPSPDNSCCGLQAIEELNVKPKFWKDLLTDEPFTRKDIIHLQDPMNLSGRNMEQFDHVKKKLRLISEEEEAKLRVSLIPSLGRSAGKRLQSSPDE